MNIFRTLIVSTLLSCWASQAVAFKIDGSKWIGARATFLIDLSGTAASGINWNSAFSSAAQEWNSKTPFTFNVIQQSKDPCLNDGLNGVDFAADFCGSAFSKGTLAVTVRRYKGELLGPWSIEQADIVINQNESFNVYDGKLIQFGIVGLDMRRVALHELGHVLGLDHEQAKLSIMAPNIGNLYQLQADDIAGVETLYGGLANCAIKRFNFGVINDALDSSDCTVAELTLSETDTSRIDLYQFDIANTTTFAFAMTSTSLDSVLLIADTDLRIIAFDTKSTNLCSSTLNTTLQPGSYFLLANTYDVPVKQECGGEGAYQISTSFSSSSLLSFADNDSLSGGPAFGTFHGGITANNGLSYSNQFRSTDSIDINASIDIDPQHQGKPGFLVVAALFDGEIHLLNQAGQFIPFSSNPGVIEKVQTKVLAGKEDISIATNLVPASLGISSIVVDFVVGYGLDSNPDEVYFHSTPLNLTVSP